MDRAAFRVGVRDVLPALPPNVTFGLLFGATAVEVGFGPAQATAMSLFIFAGTAQMAAVELLRADAFLPVVLLTVLVLNLRYSIYSASIAPEVRDLSVRWRAIMGYALSDINYALSIARFRSDGREAAVGTTTGGDPGGGVHRGWYYLGTTIPFVASFTAATFVGAVAGMSIGDALDLAFAIPLIFIALLVPTLDGRTGVVAAVVAAVVGVAGAGLPLNVGFLVAIVCGVGAGVLASRVGGEREWGGGP